MDRSIDSDALYAELRAADPDVMDRDELVGLCGQIASFESWIDALKVRVTRRQRGLASEGRGEAPKDLLAKHGGLSGKQARAADQREQICAAMPGFEDALAAGGVSAGHVDALAHATRNLDDAAMAEFVTHSDSLLNDAGRAGADVFERHCRDLARWIANQHHTNSGADELERQRAASKVSRWVDKVTGMRHTHLELDPVRDAKLWKAIARHRNTLRQQPGNATTTWAQLEVDAVIEAVTSEPATAGERIVELSVLIDLDTLLNGLHTNSVCELADGTTLPVSTVRQMACEAELIPIVLNGQGQALDVGRSKRLATTAQRHALTAMHRTCVFPGCETPVEDCRMHHVQPFGQGGPTDLANEAPLCEINAHHTLVHEGGWGFTLTIDRIATFTRPDGIIHYQGPIATRAPRGVAALVAA